MAAGWVRSAADQASRQSGGREGHRGDGQGSGEAGEAACHEASGANEPRQPLLSEMLSGNPGVPTSGVAEAEGGPGDISALLFELWTENPPTEEVERDAEREQDNEEHQGDGEVTHDLSGFLDELRAEAAQNEAAAEEEPAEDEDHETEADESLVARAARDEERRLWNQPCPASLQLMRNPLFDIRPWRKDAGEEAAAACCSICLAEFEEGQEVVAIVRCGHRFHLHCLRRWMEEPPFSCPMCRIDASLMSAKEASAGGVGGGGAAHRHGWQPVPRGAAVRLGQQRMARPYNNPGVAKSAAAVPVAASKFAGSPSGVARIQSCTPAVPTDVCRPPRLSGCPGRSSQDAKIRSHYGGAGGAPTSGIAGPLGPGGRGILLVGGGLSRPPLAGAPPLGHVLPSRRGPPSPALSVAVGCAGGPASARRISVAGGSGPPRPSGGVQPGPSPIQRICLSGGARGNEQPQRMPAAQRSPSEERSSERR
eukprot:TRINITY_DN75900_c0_g1_i1.p1 TRINITY_DN75900_c0_g1~~TRINITY_DN75900_c0_g1_i1.p1  ORF type:complete len:489 (+),score=90.14 TRINITY_DN75900_c0_g1_i1:27-1469(+)